MTDIINEVKSAPDTFTSWDKCMEKTYCKYPAIVGIVVGSLILLSFLWCVVQCLCCGATLCKCCCGGCGGCGSGRDRRSKHKDDYTRMPPTPYGGYQPAPAPMAYGAPQFAPQYAPQFATFDDPSRKIHEDSLPPMPSWDTATKRRVEDTSDLHPHNPNGDLEMGRLDPHAQGMRGGYDSVPNGPLSPQPDHYPNNNGMNQPYNSDLGAQRMAPNGNDYNSFQAVPLSPPPTYRSDSVAPSSGSDKFMSGTASPSPGDYNRQQSYQHQQPSSYAPSSISTRYEAPQHDYSPYNGQQQYQAQTPSFLQPGRKPVNGSYREV